MHCWDDTCLVDSWLIRFSNHLHDIIDHLVHHEIRPQAVKTSTEKNHFKTKGLMTSWLPIKIVWHSLNQFHRVLRKTPISRKKRFFVFFLDGFAQLENHPTVGFVTVTTGRSHLKYTQSSFPLVSNSLFLSVSCFVFLSIYVCLKIPVSLYLSLSYFSPQEFFLLLLSLSFSHTLFFCHRPLCVFCYLFPLYLSLKLFVCISVFHFMSIPYLLINVFLSTSFYYICLSSLLFFYFYSLVNPHPSLSLPLSLSLSPPLYPSQLESDTGWWPRDKSVFKNQYGSRQPEKNRTLSVSASAASVERSPTLTPPTPPTPTPPKVMQRFLFRRSNHKLEDRHVTETNPLKQNE